MAKVYVSYKYRDSSVYPLPGILFGTTVRQYVDLVDKHLTRNGHIFKGEDDGEDLTGKSDDYIAQLLKDRMFDSTVTLVLISKNMKVPTQIERDQWIPWEISYSLREQTREDRTSGTNAVLAVIIPDENNSYDYFVRTNICCTTWFKDSQFKIIGSNMFNRKEKNFSSCSIHGQLHRDEHHSYIHPVKWRDFVSNVNGYINTALQINGNINDFDIIKEI